MSTIVVTNVERNEGSIVVFGGIDPDTSDRVSFGADHRPARDLADALEAGEQPEVEVSDWQIVSRLAPPSPDLPAPYVPLVGEDGNAFAILARFVGAARRAGWPDEAVQYVHDTAVSGDYDNLLRTIMEHSTQDHDEGDE